MAVALLAVAAAALAGCTAPPPPVVPPVPPPGLTDPHHATIVIPPRAFDPNSGGPWYVPDLLEMQPPARIRIYNNDTAWHRILGLVGDVGTPDWVQEAAGGAHSHAASAAAFDVSLDPGQEAEVEVTQEGPIRIHCHPHPWMTGLLAVGPPGVHDYPVVLSRLSLTAEAAGTQDVDAQPSRTLALNASAPSLEEIRVLLSWDDAKDDGAAGAVANQPDTMRLTLTDPTGTVRATANGTARTGTLALALRPGPAWPASVTAANWTEAQRRIDEAHPTATDQSGTWSLEVRLVAAPGPIAQAPGSTQAAGQADGRQEWTMEVEVAHAWGVAAGLPNVMHGILKVTG